MSLGVRPGAVGSAAESARPILIKGGLEAATRALAIEYAGRSPGAYLPGDVPGWARVEQIGLPPPSP
ncbi:MAG TPA: hypothetical protein VLD61_11320 [Methylomirabilota bacterium]|nr:hypothetical protein [Methylomirabilota bacterium]